MKHTIIECCDITVKLIAGLLLEVESDQVKFKTEYVKLATGKNTGVSSFAFVLDTPVHKYLLGEDFFLKILFILFLDRGEGKEKEKERNINVWLPLTRPLLGTWPSTQACALTGNGTGDPLVGSSIH